MEHTVGPIPDRVAGSRKDVGLEVILRYYTGERSRSVTAA